MSKMGSSLRVPGAGVPELFSARLIPPSGEEATLQMDNGLYPDHPLNLTLLEVIVRTERQILSE